MNATPTHQRITALDGLRGVAILGVLAWHYIACVPRAKIDGIGRATEVIASIGWTGVPLFFVLSGFLIGRILIRERGTDRYLRVFYLRRACRILPLYLALLFFVGLIVPRDHGIQGPWTPHYADTIPAWSYAVFLQNIFMAKAATLGSGWFAVTWSLAVEEQFYLLLPAIVCLVAPKRLPAILLGGIVLCWVYRSLATLLGTHVYVSMLTLPGRMDGLLIGALLAWAWEREDLRDLLQRHRHIVHWIGLAAIVTVGGFEFGLFPVILRPFYSILGFSLLSIFFISLINAALINDQGLIPRVLDTRTLRFFGGISYFAYLFHQPVNYLVHGFLRDDAPSIADSIGVVASCLSLAIIATSGAISLRFFEGPILRWGRSVAYDGRRIQRLALVGTVSDPSPMPANSHLP